MMRDKYLKMIEGGMTPAEVARKCKVTRQAVSAALRGIGRTGKGSGNYARKHHRGDGGTAKCYKCRRVLPVSEFHKGRKGRPTELCKVCTSIKMARYQAGKLVREGGIDTLIDSINRLKMVLAVKEKVLVELNNSMKANKG